MIMFSCVQTHLRLCLVLPIIAKTRVVCKTEISGILPGCDGVAQGPRSECWSVAVHFLPPRGAVWGVHRDVFRVYQGSISAYPTPVCETSRTRTRAAASLRVSGVARMAIRFLLAVRLASRSSLPWVSSSSSQCCFPSFWLWRIS